MYILYANTGPLTSHSQYGWQLDAKLMNPISKCNFMLQSLPPSHEIQQAKITQNFITAPNLNTIYTLSVFFVYIRSSFFVVK